MTVLDNTAVKFMFRNLYMASRDYFLLQETGEGDAEEVTDRMFKALVDATLTLTKSEVFTLAVVEDDGTTLVDSRPIPLVFQLSDLEVGQGIEESMLPFETPPNAKYYTIARPIGDINTPGKYDIQLRKNVCTLYPNQSAVLARHAIIVWERTE